jgi:hypothetical protein
MGSRLRPLQGSLHLLRKTGAAYPSYSGCETHCALAHLIIRRVNGAVLGFYQEPRMAPFFAPVFRPGFRAGGSRFGTHAQRAGRCRPTLRDVRGQPSSRPAGLTIPCPIRPVSAAGATAVHARTMFLAQPNGDRPCRYSYVAPIRAAWGTGFQRSVSRKGAKELWPFFRCTAMARSGSISGRP